MWSMILEQRTRFPRNSLCLRAWEQEIVCIKSGRKKTQNTGKRADCPVLVGVSVRLHIANCIENISIVLGINASKDSPLLVHNAGLSARSFHVFHDLITHSFMVSWFLLSTGSNYHQFSTGSPKTRSHPQPKTLAKWQVMCQTFMKIEQTVAHFSFTPFFVCRKNFHRQNGKNTLSISNYIYWPGQK